MAAKLEKMLGSLSASQADQPVGTAWLERADPAAKKELKQLGVDADTSVEEARTKLSARLKKFDTAFSARAGVDSGASAVRHAFNSRPPETAPSRANPAALDDALKKAELAAATYDTNSVSKWLAKADELAKVLGQDIAEKKTEIMIKAGMLD
jgi:hypothetical protein